MKSAYATAAIDPRISVAGSHFGPPAATSLRSNDREVSEVRVSEGVLANIPIVISFLAIGIKKCAANAS